MKPESPAAPEPAVPCAPARARRLGPPLLALGLGLCCTLGAGAQDPAGPPRGRLFEDMGDYRCPFRAGAEDAFDFLNQGMIWLQSFNHDEAIRSFREATDLDPTCAMAWWGIAYAEGPNYNDPFMDEGRTARAWEALGKARAALDDASPAVERDLIGALAARYEASPPGDALPRLNQAYADAMAEVWEDWKDHPEVGMLYAEALMMLKPWQLYDHNRVPAEGSRHIEEVLERVLELAPRLPGANHLYIHAVEMSPTPQRGTEAADRLCGLVPGSAHLRHMPAHIYTRTGRWQDAVAQGKVAMAVGRRYLELSPVQRLQYSYVVHDSHILAYSAMMAGREAEAMDASREMWQVIPEGELAANAAWVDRWMCSVYDVQKRFGRWKELIGEDAPPECLPYTTAMWRAHRAISYAALKDFANAEREYAKFREIYAFIAGQESFGTLYERFSGGPVPELEPLDAMLDRLEVIHFFVPGEIALQEGFYQRAVGFLRLSVRAEDRLGFGGEPPEYLQPIRHTLGAVYLKMGRFAEAEEVFRRDLEEFPENGYSLFGLHRALAGLGRAAAAADAHARYETAWKLADEPLETPCPCIPDLAVPGGPDAR